MVQDVGPGVRCGGSRARRVAALGVVAAAVATAATTGAVDHADGSSPAQVDIVSVAFRYVPGDDPCITRGTCGELRDEDGPVPVPVVRVPPGAQVFYTNLDLVPHDLRARAVEPSTAEPVFEGVRSVAVRVPVEGAEALTAGQRYEFFCTLHPPRADGSGMRGIIEVMR